MSLPIVEDEDDDVDVEEPEHRTVRAMPPKTPSLSSKLLVVHSGEEDCFWCGRAFDKSKMKRITMAGLPAYKCERC